MYTLDFLLFSPTKLTELDGLLSVVEERLAFFLVDNDRCWFAVPVLGSVLAEVDPVALSEASCEG